MALGGVAGNSIQRVVWWRLESTTEASCWRISSRGSKWRCCLCRAGITLCGSIRPMIPCGRMGATGCSVGLSVPTRKKPSGTRRGATRTLVRSCHPGQVGQQSGWEGRGHSQLCACVPSCGQRAIPLRRFTPSRPAGRCPLLFRQCQRPAGLLHRLSLEQRQQCPHARSGMPVPDNTSRT